MPPTRFSGDPITVEFDQPPLFARQPSCPARFTWFDDTYEIVANLQEWRDYGRRGQMASNMRPGNKQNRQSVGENKLAVPFFPLIEIWPDTYFFPNKLSSKPDA